MDKRFWSGAIIVVTVAVAGAGALPTLLLRPSAEPIRFEATLAAASAVAKPESKAVPAAVPVPVSAPAVAGAPTPPAAPAASAPPAPTASAPVALQTPLQSERTAAAPPVAATPPAVAPTPPEPPREAKAEPFPPVQPVGVASRSEATPDVPARVEKPRTVLAKRAVRKWIRLARSRAARIAKRNGNIRPAAYPIGEFLAWRP